MYGIVHFVFKAVDSLKIDVYLYLNRTDTDEMPLFGGNHCLSKYLLQVQTLNYYNT